MSPSSPENRPICLGIDGIKMGIAKNSWSTVVYAQKHISMVHFIDISLYDFYLKYIFYSFFYMNLPLSGLYNLIKSLQNYFLYYILSQKVDFFYWKLSK